MKKGIAVSLVLALLLSVMVFVPLQSSEALGWLSAQAGPSQSPSDDPLAESFRAIYDQESAHMDMDMALDLNMVISSDGQALMSMPMSIALTLGMDEQIKPACAFMQMTMNMNAMGSEQTMNVLLYTEQSDEGYAVYSSTDDGENWTVSKSKTGVAPKFDFESVIKLLADNIKDFEATGTEIVDGVETVVYSGKMDTSFLKQAIEEAGEADALNELSENTGLSEDFFSTMGDIPFTMNVDPNTHLPLKYTMDMTDVLKNMMGSILKAAMGMGDMDGYELDVQFDTAIVNCRMKDYNAVGPVEVPESVKAVAVEAAEVPEVAATP